MEHTNPTSSKDKPLSIGLAVVLLVIGGALVYRTQIPPRTGVQETKNGQPAGSEEALYDEIAPPDGVVLPVRWGDLGKRLTASGVIDADKFTALYKTRGGLRNEEKQLLEGAVNGNLKITRENAGFLLNLLWAFGLGNKNAILEQGPMNDAQYGGAGRFASTGGWTLAKGDAMDHYSAHQFTVLTPEEQALVENVSKHIYRPCCNNPTYFPDCNHGMAMLGLLELLASQGATEDEMYRAALQVNAFWFPDTYLAAARYLAMRGIAWHDASPKELLGYDFSSASGYQKILEQIPPSAPTSGGSCGT